jgi:hypothetical protein
VAWGDCSGKKKLFWDDGPFGRGSLGFQVRIEAVSLDLNKALHSAPATRAAWGCFNDARRCPTAITKNYWPLHPRNTTGVSDHLTAHQVCVAHGAP